MDGLDTPQPDFNRVVACHNAMAEEMAKVQNIPAVAGGQAILNALNVLTTRMDAIGTSIDAITTTVDALTTTVDALTTTVDALTTRTMANDYNGMSRIQNTYAKDADSPLAELHNPATNQPIPNFPATSRTIDQLQAGDANALLSALDQGTAGTLPIKKQRIRVVLGLPAVRVTSAGP